MSALGHVRTALCRIIRRDACDPPSAEPATDEDVAQDMERAEMGTCLPAEHHLQQMACVVREPVDAGIAGL